MKSLLATTAILEGATGLALLALPTVPVSILVGAPLETPAALAVARIAGAALLALAVACWMSRSVPQSNAARSIVAAMLIYNVATVAILVHARVGAGLAGVGLWPAATLHAALTVWCAASLAGNRELFARPDRARTTQTGDLQP